MNEAIKEQAIKAIGDLAVLTKEVIVAGVKVLQVEFPELCEQIIVVEILYCSMWMLFGFMCLIIPIGWYLLTWKMWDKTRDNDFFSAGCVVATIFGFPLSASFILPNIFWIGKAALAPKLYLIEYFAALVK